MSEALNTRQTLIERVQDQTDENSWEEFVSLYSPYIYVVCKNLGVLPHDIEDVKQKILVRVWKGLPDFKYDPQKCKFRTWVNSIVFNCARNHMRSKKSYQARNQKYNFEMGNQSSSKTEVEDLMEKEWKKHIAQLALDNIKDSVSKNAVKCFEMFYEGTKVDKICEVLNLKRNSAFVLRKRVLERLRIEIIRLDNQMV